MEILLAGAIMVFFVWLFTWDFTDEVFSFTSPTKTENSKDEELRKELEEELKRIRKIRQQEQKSDDDGANTTDTVEEIGNDDDVEKDKDSNDNAVDEDHNCDNEERKSMVMLLKYMLTRMVMIACNVRETSMVMLLMQRGQGW